MMYGTVTASKHVLTNSNSLQCFDIVHWVTGRASRL